MSSSLAGPIRNQAPRAHTAIAMGKHTAPRPPNAWILYRSDKLKTLPPAEPGVRRAQAEVSRMLSDMWKAEGEETRSYYERLADEKKAEHSIKYPGYRFQPMKKEEKAALREQKKHEKVMERKARQQQQRNRNAQTAQGNQQQAPTAAASTVALPTPLPPPSITLIPPSHNSLYPTMTHLYHPMDLYGSAGPSPSLSLASSPTPETTPEPASDESYDPQPTTATTNAASTSSPNLTSTTPPAPTPASSGTNPYLAILGPAATQQMFSSRATSIPPFVNTTLPAAMPNILPSPSTVLPSNPQFTQPDLGQATMTLTDNTDLTGNMNPPLGFNGDMASVYNFEGLSFPAFDNNQLSFNVGDGFFNNVADLLPEGSDCHNSLEAMRVGTDIFALSNFDNTVLDANPGGELLVELGSFGQYDEFDFGSFIHNGMLDSDSTLNPPFEQNLEPQVDQPPAVEPLPQHLFDLIREGLNSGDNSPSTASHPSMPPTPSAGQVALSVDLSNTDNSCRGNQNYAPPAGAPHFASRRVAGSWKPPRFAESEGSLDDLASPCTPMSVPRL